MHAMRIYYSSREAAAPIRLQPGLAQTMSPAAPS
jgi:hypothetical protein